MQVTTVVQRAWFGKRVNAQNQCQHFSDIIIVQSWQNLVVELNKRYLLKDTALLFDGDFIEVLLVQ